MDTSPIIEIINQAADEDIFTAAALIVLKERKTIVEEYFGQTGISNPAPVNEDTLFDLASLTKVLATTPCWIKHLEKHPESLDYPIEAWIGDLPEDKLKITPRLLLAHSSGLPAWKPYYLFARNSEHKKFVIDRIVKENLDYPVGSGSIYSDLGFILLGRLLEVISGKDLVATCNDWIYEPLNLTDRLLFRPDIRSRQITQTRQEDTSGEVNDLNARALGGVSGHAGLFGTARGVAELAAEFLRSLKTDSGFFNRKILEVFVKPCGYGSDSSRALGFDTNTQIGSSCGSLFGKSSFGHTGFTGTSLWIDPDRDLAVVFLTNRVLMGEPDMRIKKLRPELHDSIIRSFY